MEWYKKKYGSIDKALSVVAIANGQLLDQALKLMDNPKFTGMPFGGVENSSLSSDQIEELMSALKAANIY